MYGLDPNTDLSELRGAVLTYVGFGQFSAHFSFSGPPDCAVSVEGAYRITSPGGQAEMFRDPVSGAASALGLLGRTVAQSDVVESGTLRISFDDGSVLEFLDSSPSYESYQLTLGDRLIVV